MGFDYYMDASNVTPKTHFLQSTGSRSPGDVRQIRADIMFRSISLIIVID